MKKHFISLLFILFIGVTIVRANTKINISDQAKASFRKEFAGAQLLEWNYLGEHQIALFILNGYRVEAYFDADGALEGFDRFISLNQLPLTVLKTIPLHFANVVITNILEITNTEGLSYLLTLERPDKSFRVKINSSGDILKVIKDKK
jgi:hypothetical protein